MENQTFKALKEVVDRFPRVRMAFLFGSRARQKTRRGSDVDVAVYWEGAPGRREEEALWAALEKAAGTDVDLIRLNDCPPTLAAEALRGIPLVIRDERFYLEYMLETTREAEDFREFVFDLWRWRKRVKGGGGA